MARSKGSLAGSINSGSFDDHSSFLSIDIPRKRNDSPNDSPYSFGDDTEMRKSPNGRKYRKESPSAYETSYELKGYPIPQRVTSRIETYGSLSRLPIRETTQLVGSAPKHITNSVPRNILRSPHKVPQVETPLSSSVGSFRNSTFSSVAKQDKTLLWDDVQEEVIVEEQVPLPFKVVSTNSPRPPVNISHQCKEIDRFTYRHPQFHNELLISRFENILTVFDSWESAAMRYADQKCLGHRFIDGDSIWTSSSTDARSRLSRDYFWFTYQQIDTQVRKLVSALLFLQCPDGPYLIWSENRPKWIVTSLALSALRGKISVPLSPTITREMGVDIINHSDAHSVFCSSSMLDRVFENIDEFKNIKRIFHFDDLSEKQIQFINSRKSLFSSITCISMKHLWELGSEHIHLYSNREPQQPEDIFTIMYTPGTEDEKPKGVLFTNTNIVSAVSGLYTVLATNFQGKQTFLSQHSLSIAIERCLAHVMLDNGYCVGFSYNSNLEDELLSLSPTILNLSPACCKEIEAIIHTRIIKKSYANNFLLQSILATPHVLHSQNTFSFLWDFAINRKVRNALGGRLQLLLSFGHYLSEISQHFLQHALNIPVLQGYGLTETFGVGCLQYSGDDETGVVGGPVPCVEILLRSSPKLGYFATDSIPAGEILIRGPCVSVGYYKGEEWNSKKYFNGYHCTGDIARLNSNGSFTILERKGNFIRVGENHRVGVARLEFIYEEHPLINRIWIYGSSSHHYLVAIAVVDPIQLQEFGKRLGILTEDIHSKDLQKAVILELNNFAYQKGLSSFEIIRNIRLLKRDFSSVNPSLIAGMDKLNRRAFEKHFSDEIDEMYGEIEI